MSKRFTETTKWDDPWFFELSPNAKLLWFFLVDHCDHAGIIELSFKIASMKIGGTVNEKHLAELQSRLHTLPCGKLVIIGFVAFQYGKPSLDCKPHNPIFVSLAKHGLDLDQLERLVKGYPNPLDTLQVQVQDKDKVKEPVKAPEKDIGRFQEPTLEEVRLECAKVGLPESEAEKFMGYHESKGWVVGRSPMKNWRAAMVTWKANYGTFSHTSGHSSAPKPQSIWELTKVLEVKKQQADALKVRHCTETGLTNTWDDDAARIQFVALRSEIKQINAKIGGAP